MFDWRVKLEVLTVIWFVYICIMIFGILREKNKLNLKYIGTVILTLLLIGSADIIKDMGRTYRTTKLNLNASGLTDIIKSDSDMLQKINTDKNLQGVSVRFATYSTEIKGKYIFTLYDADKNPLENVEVRGRDFADNEYGIACLIIFIQRVNIISELLHKIIMMIHYLYGQQAAMTIKMVHFITMELIQVWI